MWRDLNILLIVHGLPELLVYKDVEYDEEDERDDPVDHQVHIDDVHLRTELREAYCHMCCKCSSTTQFSTHNDQIRMYR
jgi:hypothetical protein